MYFLEVPVPQEVHQHTFANGLTLLAERMEHVRSAALNFLVPAGCAYDPPDQLGIGAVLADLITRGAGERDSRELTLALDNLGLDRSESVGNLHTRFWGATVATQPARRPGDLRRHPAPPAPARRRTGRRPGSGPARPARPGGRAALQGAGRAAQAPPTPPRSSNDHRGTVEGIEAITVDGVRQQYQQLLPARTAPSWPSPATSTGSRCATRSSQLFGDWEGGGRPTLRFGPQPRRTAAT